MKKSVPGLIGIDPILSESAQACVDLLEETLEQARRGNINTIGVAICMGSGFATAMAGTKAAELNLAVDVLKQKILAEIEGQQGTKQ